MTRLYARLSVLALVLVAVACSTTPTLGPSPTSLPTDIPVPTPTWTATVPPTATPLPSPEIYALDQVLGEQGYTLAVPPGEDLLAWTVADLDGDGDNEVAVRTCLDSCEEGTGSQGHLRVLEESDGSYTLSADLAIDFTFNFQPDFDVMEVLPGGRLGIVEQAPCGAHSLCLLLYIWDGAAYRSFEFSGSAVGVEVYPDGTVITGDRDYSTNPLSNNLTSVYRWDGNDYVLETVAFEGPDYEGASGAVLAYYNAISVCLYKGTFHPAYAYLSQGFQATQPYPDFAAGFAHTVRVAVEDLTLLEESMENATVEITITASDEIDGVEQDTSYEITWCLVREDSAWKLDQAQVRVR
jgi:hypothetical protein